MSNTASLTVRCIILIAVEYLEVTVQSISQAFMDHCAYEDWALNDKALKMEIICVFIPKCCASENNTFGRFIVELNLSLQEHNIASAGFGLKEDLYQVRKYFSFQ